MSSRPFLRTTIHREEVDSTNDLARALLSEGPPATPFAVRARRQTRGRGRGANRWWSDEGSLTVSIVIDPADHHLTVAHEARPALVGALALIETIADHRPSGRLGLKWPNDVEIGRRKVAGFLAERVEVEDRRFLIIGMGVNVLTRMDEAPAEVRTRAAALVDLVADPESLSLDGLLERFLDRFSRRLSDLANDDPALVDLWNAFDLLRDQPIAVAQGDRVVEGMGAGIDPLGGLILCDGAERRTLYGGTVVKT